MPIYDFIIIGLGTAGSATCMTLARRGFRVLGIDKHRPPHAMGSHHGASRSVSRAYLEGTAYVPMAMKSWELWRKLESDSGRDLLVETGNLTIGPPDSPAVTGFMASAQTYTIPHALLDEGLVIHGEGAHAQVLDHGQLGNEIVRLEDEPDAAVADLRQLIATEARHLLAAQLIGAVGGRVEAADDVHHRGFTRAGRTHDGDELAVADLDIEAVDSADEAAKLFLAEDGFETGLLY